MQQCCVRKEGLRTAAKPHSEQGQYLFLSLRQNVYIELVAHNEHGFHGTVFLDSNGQTRRVK